MDNDKTKVIMGLIVASLREGLGMSRYALAKESVETLIGLAKGLGIPAGTIVGAMEKALENPDTWLEEHERKMSRTET